MAHKHGEPVPTALETVVAQLGEIEVVLGKQVAPAVAAISATLIEAMAARDRGDAVAAVDHIGRAMDRLTVLADQLDPAEAVLMRALARTFRTALLRGDDPQVQQSTALMLQKSGGAQRKRET
jgi:hypothetical protein